MAAFEEERTALKAAVDAYVIDKDNYEDDTIKVTRVQGFRRAWDVAKLEKILPRGIFKNVVKIEVDPAKLNEYVNKGKIEEEKITPAFVETPNAPYTKWTPKTKGAGEAEAEDLAAALEK